MRRSVTVLTLALALAAPMLEAPAATATASLPTSGRAAVQLRSASQANAARLRPARVSTALANTRISSVLAARTKSKVLGSKFTMTVWDTGSGSYVYRKRSTASLRGASTTKILTAVGVLATLGPDHRMPTTVRAGTSANEVVLVAGGDPLLTSVDLKSLAASTVAALAGGAITPTPSTAPASPASPSAPASPSTPATSSTPAVRSSSTATTPATSTTSTAAAARALAGRTIVVRADGSLFPGSGVAHGWRSSYLPREVRPVAAFARDDNKARYATADAGGYFAKALKALGVSATFAGTATAAAESATLATYPGHTVAQAVSRMLLISDNDTAEMMFRQIAVGQGVPATWAGARAAQAKVLTALDIPLSGVRIVDGSGLSLDGRLTALALTSALNRALSTAHPELNGLRAWLPVAGRTGTLKASYLRFNSKPAKCAAGLIQAKTGTVADAIALAGYAAGADGQTKIFVSVVNSRPTKYSRVTTRKQVDRAASSVTGCW